MKINIGIPHALEIPALTQDWERNLQAEEVAVAMRLADELGYHSAVLGEHFLIPNRHVQASGAFYHHSTVALGVVAGQTKRLRLMSSITLLPLQSPIIQAKAWSTLDWLSGGRATAVFGAGWLEEEFDMLGVTFAERGKLCDEYIEAMLALWTQSSPSFSGKHVSFADVAFEPKPVQKPHLPLWFGGDSKAALQRIARWGQGWSAFLTPPDQIPAALDTIYNDPDYHGYPIEVFFPVSAMKIGYAHAERAPTRDTRGSWDVQELIDLCGRLGQLGVTETTIPLPRLTDFSAYLDRLRWVAEEIIPAVTFL